jgi:hypothetical protein
MRVRGTCSLALREEHSLSGPKREKVVLAGAENYVVNFGVSSVTIV